MGEDGARGDSGRTGDSQACAVRQPGPRDRRTPDWAGADTLGVRRHRDRADQLQALHALLQAGECRADSDLGLRAADDLFGYSGRDGLLAHFVSTGQAAWFEPSKLACWPVTVAAQKSETAHGCALMDKEERKRRLSEGLQANGQRRSRERYLASLPQDLAD